MPTNYDMLNLPDNRVDIQDLQRLLGGHSPMPPPLQEMQRQETERLRDLISRSVDNVRGELPRPEPVPTPMDPELLDLLGNQTPGRLGGHSPMPPPLQEMQRQDLQRILGGMQPPPAAPSPIPRPPGSLVEDLQRSAEAIGGTYSPPVPSMSYPGDTPASIMPQGPPNLPGTGMEMVPPMPNTPLQTGPQFGMGQAPMSPPPRPIMDQAPMSPPSRPQPWRPLGQFPAIRALRPGPATVGQSTVNSTAQHRPRGSQSMAPPAPQRGGLGIGGLGMESPDPQRQGTGFMSGDLAWTTPQRPSGPSYYEGLMPGSTYSPMEQQRRR